MLYRLQIIFESDDDTYARAESKSFLKATIRKDDELVTIKDTAKEVKLQKLYNNKEPKQIGL